MRHLKILNSFLFLTTAYSSFSVLIDNFTEAGSGTNKPLETDETGLGGLTPPISAIRTYSTGISFNDTTENLKYDNGDTSSLTYGLNPSLNMENIPIIRLNLDSSSLKNSVNNYVILTDSKGGYTQSDRLELTKDIKVQEFDFKSAFSNFKNPGKGDFNYRDVAKINVAFNVDGGSGEKYNEATFEIESVEAVPEPVSLLTLSTAVGVFIRKKRLKKTTPLIKI